MLNDNINPEPVKENTDSRKQGSKRNPRSQVSAIARLRREVKRTEAENNRLRKNLPNRTKISIEEGFLVITEFVSVDGKDFRHENKIPVGRTFTLLGDLFAEVISLTRQITTGRDVFSRTPTRQIGPDGKFTKDPMKDPEGNTLFLLNHLDKLQVLVNKLDNAPSDIQYAIELISKFLSSIELPPHTTKK